MTAVSYAPIAEKYYGYDISVLDLRNPTQSDGFNMLHMVNHYMDEYLQTGTLVSKAKAEKYAKVISKRLQQVLYHLEHADDMPLAARQRRFLWLSRCFFVRFRIFFFCSLWWFK